MRDWLKWPGNDKIEVKILFNLQQFSLQLCELHSLILIHKSKNFNINWNVYFFINKFLGFVINNFTIVLTTFALFTKQNSYANWFYPFKMFSFINLDFFKKFLAINLEWLLFIPCLCCLVCYQSVASFHTILVDKASP